MVVEYLALVMNYTMPQPDELIIQHTLNWIRSFVIKLNICPFAKREVNRGTLRIQVSSAQKIQAGLKVLMTEIQLLDSEPSVETTLLVFPSSFEDFFHYLDFVNEAEALLFENGYEGIYQLATFHPEYCFADAEFDDVTNFTNRSPYPMFHLLREESVEKAIALYGNTEKIPEANMAAMRKLGIEEITRILIDCIPVA